jgi:hypothetical protein
MLEAKDRVAAGLGKQGGMHWLSDTWIDYIHRPSSARWWDAHNAALAFGVDTAIGL